MVNNQNIFDRNKLKTNLQRFSRFANDYNWFFDKIANIILDNIELRNLSFENILEINPKNNFFKNYFAKKNYQTLDFSAISEENSLDFGFQKYDLVINLLDIHYINNVINFLDKIKKSLLPNGIFIGSFFGDENLFELRKSLTQAEREIYNRNSFYMPPTIDIKSSARLLSFVGFKNPIADLEKIIIEYSNPLILLQDIKNSVQGNVLINRPRHFFSKKLLQKTMENYQVFYNEQGQSYPATINLITISGEI
jgi:SAM-dependent methyltransferase